MEGYDNGRVYNIDQAKKDRNEWLEKIKCGNKDVDNEL